MNAVSWVPGLLSVLLLIAGLDAHDRHPELLAKVNTPVSHEQTFVITAYSPDSGDGISGSGSMASGKLSYPGAAACPVRLKFGTRVILTGKARSRAALLGLPGDLTCEDRFANVYREGIDINVPLDYMGLSSPQRIRLAKEFGLVRGTALVYDH